MRPEPCLQRAEAQPRATDSWSLQYARARDVDLRLGFTLNDLPSKKRAEKPFAAWFFRRTACESHPEPLVSLIPKLV